MPRPSGSPPTWATDTNYTNSTGRDWQGTATKVEPSSGEKAQGVTPARKIVAQWINWVLSRLSLWVEYFAGFVDNNDEFVYPTSKQREKYYSVANCGTTSAQDFADPDWETGNFFWQPLNDASDAVIIVELPAGASVTDLRLLVNRAANRTGTNRWQILDVLRVRASITGTPTVTTTSLLGAPVNDGGGTGLAFVVSGIATTAMASGDYWAVQVRGPTGSLGIADELYGVRVTFTDPGPRNF
jgi:hypothetical protein